jgi:hypothetical protein
MKCSQCGKEAVDPYCEEACPKHLCQECGERCNESLPDNIDNHPSGACEECPYEPDYDYEPEDCEQPQKRYVTHLTKRQKSNGLKRTTIEAHRRIRS